MVYSNVLCFFVPVIWEVHPVSVILLLGRSLPGFSPVPVLVDTKFSCLVGKYMVYFFVVCYLKCCTCYCENGKVAVILVFSEASSVVPH